MTVTRKITPEIFDKVKELRKENLKFKHIAEITGVSSSTCSTLYKFDTLEDYNEHNRKRLGRPTKSPSKHVNDEESLVRIAKALERLADAWESPRRGWRK